MRTHANCGDKKCINNVIGLEEPACPDWRPCWGQRILGIIVLVLFLLFLAVIIISAIGDHLNFGCESWELRPKEIQTVRVEVIQRKVRTDPGVYLQTTSAGICEVGRQQEAVWHHAGQAHPVPTVWIRVPRVDNPFILELIRETAHELVARACREALQGGGE